MQEHDREDNQDDNNLSDEMHNAYEQATDVPTPSLRAPLTDIEKRLEILRAGEVNRQSVLQQAHNFGALANRTQVQAYRWALEELRCALAQTDALPSFGGDAPLIKSEANPIFNDDIDRGELRSLYIKAARSMTNFVCQLYQPPTNDSNNANANSTK